jgi:hypothetical protein
MNHEQIITVNNKSCKRAREQESKRARGLIILAGFTLADTGRDAYDPRLPTAIV